MSDFLDWEHKFDKLYSHFNNEIIQWTNIDNTLDSHNAWVSKFTIVLIKIIFLQQSTYTVISNSAFCIIKFVSEKYIQEYSQILLLLLNREMSQW